jgi:hypothetical protein
VFVCILCNCVCLAIIVRGEDGAKQMRTEEKKVIPSSSFASKIITVYTVYAVKGHSHEIDFKNFDQTLKNLT